MEAKRSGGTACAFSNVSTALPEAGARIQRQSERAHGSEGGGHFIQIAR